MSLVVFPGIGFWMPPIPGYLYTNPVATLVNIPGLDAHDEEFQLVSKVKIDGGGSKTFGTSSKIGWLVGSPATFATGSTLRVGLKQASKIDLTSGPPARATAGATAFDVWDDLVGGTDTLTAGAWREETMTAGTPLTVNDNDRLAICFHLTVTSGTPFVAFRGTNAGGQALGNTLGMTLVTAGPTYAQQLTLPNLLLVFDDGTLGWFEPTKVFSTADTVTAAIGNGNSLANIVQVPFPCQIDALAAMVTTGAGGWGL